MVTNCQVCGNPMFGHRDMGFNVDGSINKDFCSDCYKFGHFTEGDEIPDDRGDGLLNNAFLPYIAMGSDPIANQNGFIGPMF